MFTVWLVVMHTQWWLHVQTLKKTSPICKNCLFSTHSWLGMSGYTTLWKTKKSWSNWLVVRLYCLQCLGKQYKDSGGRPFREMLAQLHLCIKTAGVQHLTPREESGFSSLVQAWLNWRLHCLSLAVFNACMMIMCCEKSGIIFMRSVRWRFLC